jgi:hypothetical protein
MMRGIYILCEGQSEEEFVNSILRPYLNRFEIYDVRPILMSTSKGNKGGDVTYSRLKINIEKLLNSEANILVTTFIDFFRLKTDFPNHEESLLILNKFEKVDFLENSISIEIKNERFIPYIQLHEFEGLLFSSSKGFEYLPNLTKNNLKKLTEYVNEKENPELLNGGELTAPSKRLEHLIPGFDKNKPFYGCIIAGENSIEVVLERCERFRNWTNSLIEKFKSENIF